MATRHCDLKFGETPNVHTFYFGRKGDSNQGCNNQDPHVESEGTDSISWPQNIEFLYKKNDKHLQCVVYYTHSLLIRNSPIRHTIEIFGFFKK